MGVVLESLSPSVEHTQETDLRPQMLWIGSDLQQSRSTGAEQEVINNLFVLESEPRQLVRDGEDHVHVLHRKQFLAALGEPLITSVSLALRTVPRAARVEGGGLIAALAT